MVARGFLTAWERALAAEKEGADLARVLRVLLKELLDRDLDRRLELRPAPAGTAGSADLGAVIGSLADADIEALTKARDGIANDLASGTPDDIGEAEADAMLAHYGLPGHLRRGLIVGMIQANFRAWEIVQRRMLGTGPMTSGGSKPNAPPTPPHATAPASPPDDIPRSRAKPLASALIDPFMVRRETIDRATHQVMGQERGTLRRFVEACGDRPVNEYGRGDMTGFIDTLRRLPNTYGKSPKDKNRPLAEIIAEADATEAERLTDKTVKRHLSALSQFFQFAVDTGHMTVTARNELVGNHRGAVATCVEIAWAACLRRDDSWMDQAARSTGTGAASFSPKVCHPFTLRMVIWPEASSAQNSMAAVSADGSTVCVLMRRLNSS